MMVGARKISSVVYYSYFTKTVLKRLLGHHLFCHVGLAGIKVQAAVRDGVFGRAGGAYYFVWLYTFPGVAAEERAHYEFCWI